MHNPQIKVLPNDIVVKKTTGNAKLFILTVYKNDRIIGSIPSPYFVWDDTKELSFISNLLIEEAAEGITNKAILLKNGTVLFNTQKGGSNG